MKFPPTTATRQTLDHGLDVLSHVDHAHPLVSFQVWVETGSMHELPNPGAGLSHLLEHMVFKGTKSFSGEELMNKVEELGGSWNAYTTYDRTVYYVEGPSEAAGEFLKLLFELVYLPTLPESDYEMEREVIRREIAMGNDDPHSIGWQELMQNYYPTGTKRFPIIGDLERFNAITHAEMVAYHESRYTFDNSFIMLSGDFDESELHASLRTMQQEVPARRLHEIGMPVESRLTAPVVAIHPFATPNCKVNVAWEIPDLGHSDLVALEILSSVIGGARSAILFQTLREQEQLALNLSAWTWTPKLGKGFFSVSMECLPENYEKLHTRLYELMNNLDFSALAQPLERAKKQALMSQLGTLTTVAERASDLASNWFETRSLDFTRHYLEQVSQVTVADLERVTKTYLQGTPSLSSSLVPLDFTSSNTQDDSKHSGKVLPKLATLPNKMPIVTGLDKTLPTTSFQLIYKGGIRVETEELEGIGALYSSVLSKGTQNRTAEEFALAIDELGASLSFSGGNNTFMVSGFCLAEDLEALCELVVDALQFPLFSEDHVQKEQAHLIAKIQESAFDPVRVAFWNSRRQLFGNSPYRFSRLGSEESMARISSADLQEHHRKLVGEGEGVLSVFGDLQEAHYEMLEKSFGSLPYRPQEEQVTQINFGSGRQDLTLDKEQAVIVVAYPSASISSDDSHILEVLQEYFSGMAGPLFVELREERGLAYFVSCNQFMGIDTGMFSFYMGTDPKRREEALTELQNSIAKVVKNGVKEEELEAVKKGLAAQNARADQTHLNQARTHGLNVLFGRGVEHRDHVRELISGVTVEEVSNCLKKYFSESAPVITVVSP